MFLNNDRYVDPGWLDPMVQCISDGHTIVGARLLYPDGMVQHAGGWLGPTWNNVFHRYLHDVHLKGDDPRVLESCVVSWVTGALLAIPASDFRELGGFDTGFRNGGEDVDLCLKAQLKNKSVYYCAEATAIHEEAQTPGRHDHFTPNTARFLKRWGNTDINRFIPDTDQSD